MRLDTFHGDSDCIEHRTSQDDAVRRPMHNRVMQTVREDLCELIPHGRVFAELAGVHAEAVLDCPPRDHFAERVVSTFHRKELLSYLKPERGRVDISVDDADPVDTSRYGHVHKERHTFDGAEMSFPETHECGVILDEHSRIERPLDIVSNRLFVPIGAV